MLKMAVQSTSTNFWSGLNSRANVTYLIVAVFVTILYSRNNTNSGIDYAWHYLMIEKLTRNLSLTEGFMDNWGALLVHPAGSHFVSAILSRGFGGASVIAMHVVGLVSLALCWFVVGKIVTRAGAIATTTMIGLVLFMLQMQYGMIFGYELVHNYLFGQFVASSLLFVALLLLHHYGKVNWVSFSAAALCFYGGLFFHATFSIIFLSATCVYFLYSKIVFQKSDWKALTSYVPIFLYGLAGVFIFITHPYSSGADQMRMHNGALGFSGLADGVTIFWPGYLMLIAALTYSIVALAYTARFGSSGSSIHRLNGLVNCILLGAVAITLVQLVLMHLSIVSPYIVKKNFFTIGTVFCLAGAIGAEFLFRSVAPEMRASLKNAIRQKEFLFLPALFVVVAEAKFSETKVDYADVYDAQKVARHYHLIAATDESYRKTGTFFSNLPMPINFMITVGDLQAPRTEIAHAVLHRDPDLMPKGSFILTDTLFDAPDTGQLQGRYRVYSVEAVTGFPVMISGEVKTFSSETADKRNGFSHLKTGFGVAEPWGTWTNAYESTLVFATKSVPKNDVQLTIEAFPFLAKNHTSLEAKIFVNGKFLLDKSFVNNGGESWTIKIPKTFHSNGNQFEVKFAFGNPVSPKQLQMSEDTRILGLGFQSASIAY